jgi:tRNA U38,U39,U40 pseudouridine synthase TruA
MNTFFMKKIRKGVIHIQRRNEERSPPLKINKIWSRIEKIKSKFKFHMLMLYSIVYHEIIQV